jgi:hypothetical protein
MTCPAPSKRVGAVVVFKAGVTLEQVKNWLEYSDVERFDAKEYNPDHGEPVFYIP